MQEYNVIFNSNNLAQVNGVWLYNYTATDLPQRDIKIHKLARRSLSIITSSEYTQKAIPVLMRVCSGGRQDTEATLTEVKGLLQAQNGTLEIEQSGIEVKYTATMNEFDIEWDRSTAYVTIIFLASTPIATASELTNLANLGVTTPSASTSFTVGGSYLAEPYITITINSVTGGTGQSLSVFNGSTNQGITITGNFANSDIIEIDSRELVVTHNGANIDFDGLFPTFPPGAQTLGYTDTFSTRNIDIDVKYNIRIV